MAEKNYTKRETDEYRKDMKNHMNAQDIMLKQILEQTSKTNGRVSKLEWLSMIFKWAIGALGTFIVIVSPVLWYFLKLEIQQITQDSAHNAVTSALSQYNIIVKQ